VTWAKPAFPTISATKYCAQPDLPAMSDPKPDALTSPLLTRHGFRHAFFTRLGGVSEGPYASLNFSFSVGDDANSVDRNLRAAAKSLGLSVSRLYFLSQVHGNHCVELGTEADQRSVVFTEGDALVSGETDVGCGVRTADCVPVLIADPVTGRVGAAHAGWRGLVAEVIKKTMQQLVNPSDAARCVAAIGPHIEAQAFEVSEDVAGALAAASPGADPVVRGYAKPHVSLRQVAEAQLLALGLRSENIDHVAGCTFTDATRFFSFRRDGKASGRHLSVIVAR
jgi:polyphenol oxidase